MPRQPGLLSQSVGAAMEKSLLFRQPQADPFWQSQRNVPLLFCLCCNQKLPVDTINLTIVYSFPKTHRVDGPSSVNTVQLSALETSCTPAVSNTVKTTLRYLFRNVHVGFIKAWETKLYFNNRR